MVADFVLCWIVEKGCKFLFANLEPAEIVTRGRDRREKARALEEKSGLTNGHTEGLNEKANGFANGSGMPALADVVKKTQ